MEQGYEYAKRTVVRSRQVGKTSDDKAYVELSCGHLKTVRQTTLDAGIKEMHCKQCPHVKIDETKLDQLPQTGP